MALPFLHKEGSRRHIELKGRPEIKVVTKCQREGESTTYFEVVNYLLEVYATGDSIAETDAEFGSLTQASNKTPIEYAKPLWAKAPRCHRARDKYVLKVNFSESLQD